MIVSVDRQDGHLDRLLAMHDIYGAWRVGKFTPLGKTVTPMLFFV